MRSPRALTRALQGLTFVALGCNAPPPAPPPVLVLPVASAAPPSASSAAPATPCAPRVWLAVELPPADFSFGDPEPDRAALAAASPALRSVCATIERTAKQHQVSVFSSGEGPFGAEAKRAVWKSTTMGCYAGPKGAWAIELGVFHRDNAVGERAPWQLVHLMPDGGRITSKAARGDAWEADGEGRIGTAIAGVHDFDGDGVDEVAIVTSGYAAIDGYHDSGPVLYHLQDGAILPWDPVPSFHVVGSLDVDHDGRLDLLLDKGAPHPELAHALDGGRYSVDDDVTRAFLHGECLLPPPTKPLLVFVAPVPATPDGDARAKDRLGKQCDAVLAMDACPR